MHRPSVLHFHAAEKRRPFDVQALDSRHVRVGLQALVGQAAEDRDHLGHGDPVLRKPEYDAVEQAGNVDCRRVPPHAGAPQIDLYAAENGGHVTPPKSAAPLMYRRLTPGMSAFGSRLLLAKPPKIATTCVTAIQFSGSLSMMPPNKLVTY